MPARTVTARPTAAATTGRAVERAASWLEAGRRVDMQGLADELAISRATLFRRVGGREELISAAVRLLTDRTLAAAAAMWRSQRPEGALHTTGTGHCFHTLVSGSTALRRLLDDEPALALRVLTDPRGSVQSAVVAFFEALLRRDMAEHGLQPLIDPGDLAYALVRLGESFLYADVLAARQPDLATAERLQRALIEGHRGQWPAASHVGPTPTLTSSGTESG